eukprot:Lankesteria_metandrocarpae@DN2936_c0_g1_i2.p1
MSMEHFIFIFSLLLVLPSRGCITDHKNGIEPDRSSPEVSKSRKMDIYSSPDIQDTAATHESVTNNQSTNMPIIRRQSVNPNVKMQSADVDQHLPPATLYVGINLKRDSLFTLRYLVKSLQERMQCSGFRKEHRDSQSYTDLLNSTAKACGSRKLKRHITCKYFGWGNVPKDCSQIMPHLVSQNAIQTVYSDRYNNLGLLLFLC